jgi:type I restriction enzyme, S subunit
MTRTVPRIRLQDLAEVTSAKRIFASDYVTEGVPFYRGKEITELDNGVLNVSTPLFIKEDYFSEIERKYGVPKAGDILLTAVGTLGSVYCLKESDRFYFKDGNIVWFRNLNGVRGEYLKYWLKSPDGRAELRKCVIGSSQSAYTIDRLKRMEVILPSVHDQDVIVSTLGAYDGLIQANRRRIAVLEDMARQLFEEWFIRERVSTEAATEFNNEVLGEVAEVRWGDTTTTKASYVPEGYIAYSASGPDGFLDHYDHEGLGIVLSAIGAQCGKVWLADGRWSCIKNTIVLKAKHERTTTRILYLLFSREDIWPKRGAAQPFISQGDARKIVVRLPTFEVQNRFDELVAPMLDQCRTLEQANRLLASARDLLLPRLVSGELSVSVAERELESAA